jgi:Flp pilus assembly pilin Flp
MRRRNARKNIGQSTVEYAVLLAIVAAALIGMQVYLKRGLQGRVKDLADQISPPSSHYERGWTKSDYRTEQTGTVVYEYKDGIGRTYQDGADPYKRSTPEKTERKGQEEVSPDYE